MTCAYNQTPSYRAGQMYKELGELLMHPHTTVHELADFGVRYDLDMNVVLQPIAKPKGATE